MSNLHMSSTTRLSHCEELPFFLTARFLFKSLEKNCDCEISRQYLFSICSCEVRALIKEPDSSISIQFTKFLRPLVFGRSSQTAPLWDQHQSASHIECRCSQEWPFGGIQIMSNSHMRSTTQLSHCEEPPFLPTALFLFKSLENDCFCEISRQYFSIICLVKLEP